MFRLVAGNATALNNGSTAASSSSFFNLDAPPNGASSALDIINISISVPLFSLLSIIVLVMVFGRLRSSSTSASASAQKRALSLRLKIFFLCLVSFSIGQIIISILMPLSNMFLWSYQRVILQIVLLALHYGLYICLTASFFSIWSQASIVFDIMVASSSARAGVGSSEKDARTRRALMLKRLRITMNVLLILTLTVGLSLCIGILIAFIVVCTVVQSKEVAQAAMTWLSVAIAHIVAIMSILLALLVVLPGVLLALALRRSNALLAKQSKASNSSVANRNDKVVRRRIKEQTMAIRKLIFGLVVFCLNSVLLLIGLALIILSIAAPNSFRRIPSQVTDLVFMRVLPSASNILVMTTLFWPWTLPGILCCVMPKRLGGSGLVDKDKPSALHPMILGGSSSDGDDTSTEASQVSSHHEVVAAEEAKEKNELPAVAQSEGSTPCSAVPLVASDGNTVEICPGAPSSLNEVGEEASVSICMPITEEKIVAGEERMPISCEDNEVPMPV